MTGMVGADVDELRRLAAQFSAAADQLRSIADRVGAGLQVTAWAGPASVRFRIAWDSEQSAAVRAAAQALDDAGRRLAGEAEAQAAVSSAATGMTGRGIALDAALGADSRPAAGSAAGLWGELQDTGEDGVKVVEVVGPDGKERYVVYISGTRDWFGLHGRTENLPAVTGDASATEDAVRAAMGKIPAGAEVMLVGYSQGGIHAENIAADGGHHVTNVVTFGSPDSPGAVGNRYGADVLRITDPRDVVTHSGGVGFLNPLTAVDGIGQNVDALANPGRLGQDVRYSATGDVRFDLRDPLGVHTDAGNYGSLARDFDASAGDRYDGVKASMAPYLDGTARTID